MVVRRPGTRVQDEKKKGGTPWGEGGQTKAPGNIYYKTLVTYLDIDRSAMRWRMFWTEPFTPIHFVNFLFFPSSSSSSFYFYFRLESLSTLLDADPFYPFLKFFSFISRNESRGFSFFFREIYNERIVRLHSAVFARALNFHFDAFIRIYFIFFFFLLTTLLHISRWRSFFFQTVVNINHASL